jgi:hypothetical protein
LFGIVVLAVAYRAWLRSAAAASAPPADAEDTARWWILGSIAGLGAAACTAWIVAGMLRGEPDVQSLVVGAVFAASNLIVIVYLAAALAWRGLRSGRGRGNGPG